MNFIHIDHMGNDSCRPGHGSLVWSGRHVRAEGNPMGKNGGCQTSQTWCLNRHWGGEAAEPPVSQKPLLATHH